MNGCAKVSWTLREASARTGLLLNAVVSERALVDQLRAAKDQALLLGRDAPKDFSAPSRRSGSSGALGGGDLRLEGGNGGIGGGRHGGRAAGEAVDEDLHGPDCSSEC
jgi:hypothetical protein